MAEAQMRRMALDATGAYFVTNIDPAHAEDFAKTLSGEDERIFKDYQALAEHYQLTVAALFARRTAHKDAAWWRRFIWSGRERFLGPDECLAMGLVDEILEPALLHEAHPSL
ncbi:MAG TPA: hypothetical protein VLM76_03845 [Patescibacteria group bacterium]|nr:hypothetical protein [Patescibacteria group bacterium]